MKITVSTKDAIKGARGDKNPLVPKSLEDALGEDYIPYGEDNKGILYITEIHIEDKILVKIGITQRSIRERTSEIVESIFTRYRYYPYARPKRFRTVSNIRAKEKELLKYFANYKYKTEQKFSGSTELFDIALDEVVAEYDKIIRN